MFKRLRTKLLLGVVCCLAVSGLTLAACDHEHDFGGWEETTAATCEEAGVRTRTCKSCGATQYEAIEAKGHVLDEGEITKEATCEVDGSGNYICTVCKKTMTQKIDRLGHLYSEEYTVDIAPTVESEGSESRHCTREGCNSRIDTRTVAKLVDERDSYHVTVQRRGGKTYTSQAKLQVLDSDGTLIQEVNVKRGESTFKLPEGNYKVKVTNLLEGYSSVEEEYELAPELVIELKAGLLEDDGKSHEYLTHSVMHDTTIEFYDGKTTTISELLTEYKAVHMLFFFKECGACVSEWPRVKAYYEKYGSDVAIFAMNFSDESKAIVDAYVEEHDVVLPVAKGASLRQQFGITAAPWHIFIDREGVVAYDYGIVMQNGTEELFEGLYEGQIQFADALEAESAQPSKISYDLDLPVSSKTLLSAENEEQGARKN